MDAAPSEMMRAVVLDKFGGPEVLRLGMIERPRAAPGNIVVRTAYAGVNPADWKAREGWLARYFDYRFPFVVGFDAAGIVAEVGEGVNEFAIGDRVVTASNQGIGERGSYADYVASAAERCAKLPGSISLRDAAALPTAGITAFEAVFDVGQAGTGGTVLVNGGAGGTGGYAIQLARMAGARVAATCGPDNLDYVQSLGAELAIDYRKGGVADAVRAWAADGVDLVVDTVGQGTLLEAIDLTRRGGIIAPIATLIADEPLFDPERAAARGVRIVPTMSSHANQPRQLRALVAALGDGRLRPPALTILPLEQAAEAQRRVAAGHVRGKILLDVDASLGR